MTHALRALIPALWILWLGYWVLAARVTRETRRRENVASRLTHYGPLILGGLLWACRVSLGRSWNASSMGPLKSGSGLQTLWLRSASAFRRGRVSGSAANWSAEVTVKQNHELVRSGPYALVRHPIYTGVLFALIGTALSVDKWRALVGLA